MSIPFFKCVRIDLCGSFVVLSESGVNCVQVYSVRRGFSRRFTDLRVFLLRRRKIIASIMR